MRHGALILSVLIVASCGLGYELVASALASYLLGDSIVQFSTVIGCYLFAMGVGSWMSRYIDDADVVHRFIDIEMMIGLIGGISATLLFVVFAWMSTPFRSVLYITVFSIGFLVGMEIPIIMRVFHQEHVVFKDLVSRVLSFDYLGALVVSLVFPLLLAPYLGLLRTALLFGLCNTLVALWTAWIFRFELRNVILRIAVALLIFLGLFFTFLYSQPLSRLAESWIYSDPIIYEEHTPYQKLVVTQWHDDLRLFINNNLQFSSKDEHRYHEALVHPGLLALPYARQVLVLGGGDGLAVREILKHPHIEQVTLIDLDPAMTRLFSTAPHLVALNQGAFHDPRVKVINQDAAQWLEANSALFDFIVVDLPDPSNYALGRLYSVPVYRLIQRHLSETGYMVVQSTSPYFAPQSYWTIDATLRAAGLHTWPYRAYVPSFGEWGFILASRRDSFTPATEISVPTRFLDATTMADMFRFPADMPRLDMPPNHLNDQSLIRVFEEDWAKVLR